MSNNSLKMTKVYQVAHKGPKEQKEKDPNPRFFLQHLICETAGFKPREELYVSTDENNQNVIIQNTPFSVEDKEFHKIHVSYRKNKSSGTERPIIDTAGEKYKHIVDVNQKVEVSVYNGRIVIQPLHYNLMEESTIPSPKDQRITLTSLCAGAGIGTSVFKNTGYYTPVMEIEFDEDSSEVLKHNFPSSYLFNGDLKDCHSVVQSDVVLATLPCNEASSLGFGDEGVFNNLILAAAKIIKSAKPKAVIFENVSAWYKTKSYQVLKELLKSEFPYWSERQMESAEFGSLARRDRTYAVAFTDKELFTSFEFPTPPKNKRKRKLRDYLDSVKESNYEWKPLEKWVESFNSREAWKDRKLDKTFVTADVKEIQCIPKRYRSQCASNTYVLNNEKMMWRFLTESEIMKILSVPEWFEFSPHVGTIRRYEMLGQSVDGRVLGAIANELATAFMRAKNKIGSVKEAVRQSAEEFISIGSDGQYELAL